MLAIDPGPTGAAFDALGERLRARQPKAVLVISAHWIYSTLVVGTRTRQEAWHDFGGFPRELYALRYDAPAPRTWPPGSRCWSKPPAWKASATWPRTPIVRSTTAPGCRCVTFPGRRPAGPATALNRT